MHPGHEVIDILGSGALDGLLDVGSISPVVLIPTGNIDKILYLKEKSFTTTDTISYIAQLYDGADKIITASFTKD